MTATDLQRNDDYHAYIKYEKAIEIDETNDDIYCSRAQVRLSRSENRLLIFDVLFRFTQCVQDFQKV